MVIIIEHAKGRRGAVTDIQLGEKDLTVVEPMDDMSSLIGHFPIG